LVAVSAPSYAHGVVDPVSDIGAIATETGRWFHVDACVGGMVLPFLDGAPAFDFSIGAVDSISVDLHKYGYTPKGASLVLYRDANRRSFQFFATASWTGYPVANSTVQSTKSGAPLAAAWASVQHLGASGYAHLAAEAWSATQVVLDEVRSADSVQLLVEPDGPLFAVTSANVFAHAAEMRKRGWMLGVTPSFGPSPAHLHLTMTAGHVGVASELARDLIETAAIEPDATPSLAGIDLGALDPASIGLLLDSLDFTADRALIDAAIDSLAPEARAAVISAFLQHLHR
jgi:glutamate/tyrosine decarboxylase-like PLP-dependent enzyme